MTTGNQQPVADNTKTGATPPVDGVGAQNETDPLDTLLADYDNATQKTDTAITPPQPKGDGTPNPQNNPDFQQWQQDRQDIQTWRAERQMQALDQVVQDVMGDLDDPRFDKDWVKVWLVTQAQKDERLDRAFVERVKNPAKWNAVKAELGKKLHKMASKQPDQNATEDRNAVAQAVKGASTKAPAEPAPDFSTMSAAEFEQAKRKLFRK